MQFTDYIRFQPDDGIGVTLGTVGWDVNASTDLSGGDYQPQIPSFITSPILLPYLSPTGTGHVDSNPTDSDAFPYWEETLTIPH